jgi:TIR domain
MAHRVFICYPVQEEDIVKNFAGRLRDLGVKAWIYSLDRTLAEDVWSEIQNKIDSCEVFIFVASKHSFDAKGQHREVRLALDRLKMSAVSLPMVPVLIDNISFSSLPEELSRVNGLRLDAHTVKSTAHDLAKTFFPELVTKEKAQGWKYPRPGQWLEVCNIDQWSEECFDLGDRVYFRRISPLGLFECYSPKLAGLFWFAPHNLRATDILDEDGSLERQDVPWSYRYSASYDFERIGIDEMKKQGKIE